MSGRLALHGHNLNFYSLGAVLYKKDLIARIYTYITRANEHHFQSQKFNWVISKIIIGTPLLKSLINLLKLMSFFIPLLGSKWDRELRQLSSQSKTLLIIATQLCLQSMFLAPIYYFLVVIYQIFYFISLTIVVCFFFRNTSKFCHYLLRNKS